jgi:hypothetical protein
VSGTNTSRFAPASLASIQKNCRSHAPKPGPAARRPAWQGARRRVGRGRVLPLHQRGRGGRGGGSPPPRRPTGAATASGARPRRACGVPDSAAPSGAGRAPPRPRGKLARARGPLAHRRSPSCSPLRVHHDCRSPLAANRSYPIATPGQHRGHGDRPIGRRRRPTGGSAGPPALGRGHCLVGSRKVGPSLRLNDGAGGLHGPQGARRPPTRGHIAAPPRPRRNCCLEVHEAPLLVDPPDVVRLATAISASLPGTCPSCCRSSVPLALAVRCPRGTRPRRTPMRRSFPCRSPTCRPRGGPAPSPDRNRPDVVLAPHRDANRNRPDSRFQSFPVQQ